MPNFGIFTLFSFMASFFSGTFSPFTFACSFFSGTFSPFPLATSFFSSTWTLSSFEEEESVKESFLGSILLLSTFIFNTPTVSRFSLLSPTSALTNSSSLSLDSSEVVSSHESREEPSALEAVFRSSSKPRTASRGEMLEMPVDCTWAELGDCIISQFICFWILPNSIVCLENICTNLP